MPNIDFTCYLKVTRPNLSANSRGAPYLGSQIVFFSDSWPRFCLAQILVKIISHPHKKRKNKPKPKPKKKTPNKTKHRKKQNCRFLAGRVCQLVGQILWDEWEIRKRQKTKLQLHTAHLVQCASAQAEENGSCGLFKIPQGLNEGWTDSHLLWSAAWTKATEGS